MGLTDQEYACILDELADAFVSLLHTLAQQQYIHLMRYRQLLKADNY